MSLGHIGVGRKTIAAAGTAEALASDTPAKKVDIQAELDNTDVIVVGDSNVIANLATRKGIALRAGESYSFEIINLSHIYIDAVVNGEGVIYAYFK